MTDIRTCFATELAAANPSAEEPEDMGGEEDAPKVMVYDIEEVFQLQQITDMKPGKGDFKKDLTGMPTMSSLPSYHLEYPRSLSENNHVRYS